MVIDDDWIGHVAKNKKANTSRGNKVKGAQVAKLKADQAEKLQIIMKKTIENTKLA